jgi:LPXTG-site transpeptidase (sortase) family protein
MSEESKKTNATLVAKFTSNIRKHNLYWLIAVILAVALSVLIIQRGVLESGGQVSDGVITSTDRPSEVKPGADYDWRGGESDPKKIVIENIGVDAFVQKVGVDKNQQIAVPNNIHIAGWFADSVKVGEKGLSIIDGHVDGLTTGGVFKELSQLKSGDSIKIEKGDGSLVSYEVMQNITVPLNESAGVLYSQDPKVESQLNLITCIGNFDRNSQTYDKRIIVTAKKTN